MTLNTTPTVIDNILSFVTDNYWQSICAMLWILLLAQSSIMWATKVRDKNRNCNYKIPSLHTSNIPTTQIPTQNVSLHATSPEDPIQHISKHTQTELDTSGSVSDLTDALKV